MQCDCKNIPSDLLDAMYDYFMPSGSGGFMDETQKKWKGALDGMAVACGMERVDGHYEQFPKREQTLSRLGAHSIVHEHDDGDLTIDLGEGHIGIVTTDGKLFLEQKGV